MRNYIFILLVACSSVAHSQSKRPSVADSGWTIPEVIYMDKVNGFTVQDRDDTFYTIVNPRIDMLQRKNLLNCAQEDYPGVFLKNNRGTQYLQLMASPGGYYGDFVTIGYFKKGKKYGDGIGKINIDHFKIDEDVALGDSMLKVWKNKHLQWFRTFSHKGIKYFYYEKGTRVGFPYVPYEVLYYKFKNEKLIEIGFGTGFGGINPLFRME